ncbi:hypothetical protein P43SY_000365 [Pythium insidiosum]|uniref:Dymeclin n=1 Tax=Pythium insidiosum TaxID=114742 RepID=A0AAD5M6D1_PYTIN|nr:hypothetical protein P43SY_000365 [Pythium insidiosum]
MGGATSTFSRSEGLRASPFASQVEQAAFEKIVGALPVPREDPAYNALFNTARPLTHLTQPQVEWLNHEYGTTLAQNNLQSGNFRVLVRFVLHTLPQCCRMEKMSPDELEAHSSLSSNGMSLPTPVSAPMSPGSAAAEATATKSKLDTQIHQTVNALFLVRNFIMRFVEKQDESSLLAHFNQVALPDYSAVMSPRNRSNTAAIRVAEPSAARSTGSFGASVPPPPLLRQPSTMNDDLAFRFLDALLTVLVDFAPTPRTHDLHLEVLSTLLVLLSPVAFPRDHRKDADDLSAHNPFLHMLMTSASSSGKKSFWALGVVQRLLHNYMEPLQAPAASMANNSVAVALRNADETSLIKISENVDASSEDADQFSYLTLEGLGSLASTIFRFPLSFYNYFVATDGHAYPIADRSALLLLVLMQSCRDAGSPPNPFREVLCSITNTEKAAASEEIRLSRPESADSRLKAMELPFTQLFASIGRKAPYESSHLLLYTMLYANPVMHDAAISNCDVDHVMLPLLETLYHAKSVDPTRVYMLVIVLLTYTQDPTFVRESHSKTMVQRVPWYSERYILDISLGSLMIVIFTRLIYRNITHFHDSFIHLNAFAALSNLARYAENIHVYAAQSVVGLIEMLAKMEAKFSARMEREQQQHNEELIQKRNAYVEFIRLLLGIVSSCLKPALLPRNPQLIYSLLYRAETFTKLQQHPEIAHQVNNWSVWNTLSKFQSLVESKTTPDDSLDVHTILEIIQAECVSILAASTLSTSRHVLRGTVAGTASASASAADADDDASYRYEEESDPEQFFVPYVWKLVFEQTPEFCWKVDKITLFAASRSSTQADA